MKLATGGGSRPKRSGVGIGSRRNRSGGWPRGPLGLLVGVPACYSSTGGARDGGRVRRRGVRVMDCVCRCVIVSISDVPHDAKAFRDGRRRTSTTSRVGIIMDEQPSRRMRAPSRQRSDRGNACGRRVTQVARIGSVGRSTTVGCGRRTPSRQRSSKQSHRVGNGRMWPSHTDA